LFQSSPELIVSGVEADDGDHILPTEPTAGLTAEACKASWSASSHIAFVAVGFSTFIAGTADAFIACIRASSHSSGVAERFDVGDTFLTFAGPASISMNGTSIALLSLQRLDALVPTVVMERVSDSPGVSGELLPEEEATEGLLARTVDSEIQSTVKRDMRRLSDHKLLEVIVGSGAVLGRGFRTMPTAAGS